MAKHLVDVQNDAQFVKNLAVLAKQSANLRTTYLVASDVEALMNDFIFDLNVFATRSRVKLPASLSSEAERDYHFMEQQVKTEKFDQFYLNESLRYLADLENRLKKYSVNGEEETARSFSSRQLTGVNKSYSRLKTAKDELVVAGSSNWKKTQARSLSHSVQPLR